jgi:hypothetical protein
MSAKDGPKFTKAAQEALNAAITTGANRAQILKNAAQLASKWAQNAGKKKTAWTNAEVLKWLHRRTKNEPNLNIPILMKIALNTNLGANKFNGVYKKISATRGGSKSALTPYIVQNLPPGKVAEWEALTSKLDETMQKFSTPSLRTAHSGSEFETIGVATAALSVGIPVVYFLEAANFPTKHLKDILSPRYDAKLRSTGILVLKARINLTPLKGDETNPNYKKAWFLQLVNNTTANSIKGQKALFKVANKNFKYNNPPRALIGLTGKSQNNSNWKGYADVEPDAIFFKYINDKLHIDIFEFKIGAGKPEAKPAEAYQLAKAKRSIELMPEFAAVNTVIKTHFFPLKYGQKDPKTNFYNPNMHNNVFSNTFKKSLGANFRVNVIEDKKQFTNITGIPVSPILLVLDALRKSNINNIFKSLKELNRHARVRPGVTVNNYVKSLQALQGGHGHTAANAKLALAAMFTPRMAATAGLPAGANVRAAVIRSGNRNTELMEEIYRTIRMLHAGGVKFKNSSNNKFVNMENVMSIIPKVTGARSNNPANIAKYTERFHAIRDRSNLPQIQRLLTAFFSNVAKIELVAPSANNKVIQAALKKAMENALEYKNIEAVINSLKRVGAPPSVYKSILKPYITKNETGKREREVFSLLMSKKVNAPQNLGKYLS